MMAQMGRMAKRSPSTREVPRRTARGNRPGEPTSALNVVTGARAKPRQGKRSRQGDRWRVEFTPHGGGSPGGGQRPIPGSQVSGTAGVTHSPALVERLVQRRERFLGFLERRLGNRAVAEDLLQAALVKVITRPPALRAEETLVAWFFQLLRNLLLDHYRHQAAAARLEQHAREELFDPGGDVQDLSRRICTCGNELIDALKPEDAELIRRVELAEEPLGRVAKDLGITRNNARVRLHRARRALREALRARCGACAGHGCLDCTCRTRPPEVRRPT